MSKATPPHERVLISAFACEPFFGSEPGVGWAWALLATRHIHEVWVVTRVGSRATIEAYFGENGMPPNLHFIFVDDIAARGPTVITRFLRGRSGLYLTNLAWQWAAYRAAARQHRRQPFDAVHHVTFATIRAPSFMGRLGIRFVFGPVGGGERTPWRLRRDFGPKALLFDAVRDIWNLAIGFDPLMRQTFRQAHRIYVTSSATAALVPSQWRGKVMIEPAIAINDAEVAALPDKTKCDNRFVVLYFGRFLEWKGMGFGIRAFAKLAATHPSAHLVIVGDGPAENRWRRIAETLGIAGQITWRSRIPQYEVPNLLRASDVLLFPSLHDAGGMVVLEAMQHGLPVVCLDIGGPAIFVDASCGRVIATKGVSRSQLVCDLAKGLEDMLDPTLRRRLGVNARQRARAWNWDGKIQRLTGRSADGAPDRVREQSLHALALGSAESVPNRGNQS